MIENVFLTVISLTEALVSEPFLLGMAVGIALIAAWFWPKKKRWRVKSSYRALKQLNKMESPAQKFSYLRKVDPFVFEEMILSSLKKAGVKIKRNKKYTGDGGVDGKLYIDGRLILIQAKRYANHIEPKHVREFSELCHRHKSFGLFVHTGKTGAKSLGSAGRNVVIISGHKLLSMLDGDTSEVKELVLIKT